MYEKKRNQNEFNVQSVHKNNTVRAKEKLFRLREISMNFRRFDIQKLRTRCN